MANEIVQLTVGTQVDRLSIEKKLGEGGFGAVYKANFFYKLSGSGQRLPMKWPVRAECRRHQRTDASAPDGGFRARRTEQTRKSTLL